MSNWIEHEEGKPCPVPYKWIKKVKDVAGWEFTYGKKSCLNYQGERVTSVGCDWSTHIDNERCWKGEAPATSVFTHFKLKKKYREKWESMTPFEKFCLREGYDKNGPFVLKHGNGFWDAGAEVHLHYDDGSLTPLMGNISSQGWIRTEHLTQSSTEEPAKIDKEVIDHVNIYATHSCSGAGRALKLPQHLYEKHKEVVDHWLRGGETERYVEGVIPRWITWRLPPYKDEAEYRIKKQEPSPGEVWEVDCGTECGDMNYRPIVWATVDGALRAYYFEDVHKCNENDVAQPGADWPKRFLFNSVEEYYKQKVSREYMEEHISDADTVQSIRESCNY